MAGEHTSLLENIPVLFPTEPSGIMSRVTPTELLIANPFTEQASHLDLEDVAPTVTDEDAETWGPMSSDFCILALLGQGCASFPPASDPRNTV